MAPNTEEYSMATLLLTREEFREIEACGGMKRFGLRNRDDKTGWTEKNNSYNV
ncbi:hypothetical protein PM082_022026 [Marasmius tenuissimus]|nr:hypothetical protein PM082_022026 [Marasmius tenuissimus]